MRSTLFTNQRAWQMAALLLCLLLLAQQGLYIRQAPWVGDYWEHRAVLNELIRQPLHPAHPIVAANQPHAFFSPYLMAAGG
ncbi:MAG TPA: hypothetical protein PKE63_10165, partial [Lacibacter sp.]|nr:hypothetical protein [Lacibacter sp.]